MTHSIANRRRLSLFGLSAVLIAALATPRPAAAVPIVGYSLQVSEGVTGGGGGSLMASAQLMAARDIPLFTLSNTSTEALITTFSITIGDLNYNFDAVTFNTVPTGPQVTSFSPDAAQGGARSDVATLNFANFVPSQAFAFRTDIDRDSDNGLSLTNFRTVLGGASPAMVTVSFSDGSVLTNYLSALNANGTGPLSSIYRCAALVSSPPISQSATAISQVVPEPDGLTLAALGGVGLLMAIGWRRTTATKRSHAG